MSGPGVNGSVSPPKAAAAPRISEQAFSVVMFVIILGEGVVTELLAVAPIGSL